MIKPLLYLDVDGPLNPYAAKPSRRPDGYETHRMRPSGIWQDPRVAPLRVWLNPSHGSSLLALPYDLVWATAWEHEANEWIAHHVGLPELPVIEFPDKAPHDAQGHPIHWKLPTLIKHAAGRPFAWVDDELTVHDREHTGHAHPGQALLHHVHPAKGLLDEDFHALRAWAEKLHGNEQGDADERIRKDRRHASLPETG